MVLALPQTLYLLAFQIIVAAGNAALSVLVVPLGTRVTSAESAVNTLC